MRYHLHQIPDEGIQRKLEVKAAALARLTEALGPQTGSLSADLFLKQRGGNVEVTGSLKGTLEVPCHRCLEPVPMELDEEVTVTLVPEERMAEMAEEMTLSRSDLEITFFDGDEIDLAMVIEDEALLAVPETPCGEDDDGRCTRCGRTMEDLFEAPEDDPEQHPFAQLKQFLK